MDPLHQWKVERLLRMALSLTRRDPQQQLNLLCYAMAELATTLAEEQQWPSKKN